MLLVYQHTYVPPAAARAALALFELYSAALLGAADVLDASQLLHVMPAMTFDAGRLMTVTAKAFADLTPDSLKVRVWGVCVMVVVMHRLEKCYGVHCIRDVHRNVMVVQDMQTHKLISIVSTPTRHCSS